MKLSLLKLFQFCINFTHSDSPAHFLWAARASVQHWGAGAGPSSLYRRRSYKLLWVTSSTGVLHWAVRNCRRRRVPNPVEPCGSATTGSLRRQRSFSRNSQNMLPGICAATAKNWPKNPKYSTGLRESQKWSSWSQNYGNCKRLKITFLGKFVLLTEGQYWSVNIFGLCIDTFCACGCAWKDGAEGGWPSITTGPGRHLGSMVWPVGWDIASANTGGIGSPCQVHARWQMCRLANWRSSVLIF